MEASQLKQLQTEILCGYIFLYPSVLHYMQILLNTPQNSYSFHDGGVRCAGRAACHGKDDGGCRGTGVNIQNINIATMDNTNPIMPVNITTR